MNSADCAAWLPARPVAGMKTHRDSPSSMLRLRSDFNKVQLDCTIESSVCDTTLQIWHLSRVKAKTGGAE